jgi:hypothetical protein
MAAENQDGYEERPTVKTDLLIVTDHTKIGQLENARNLLKGKIPESHSPSLNNLKTYFDEWFSRLVANDITADDKQELTSGYKKGLAVSCFLMDLRFGPYLRHAYADPLLIPGWVDAVGRKGWFQAGRTWTEADIEVDSYLSSLPELDLGALHYAKSAAGLIIASQNIQYASEIFENLGELELPPGVDPPIVEQ